jgi:hypothetical protein
MSTNTSSKEAYPVAITLIHTGFAQNAAYDTVRSLGIAEDGSAIDLKDELEAQGQDGCADPYPFGPFRDRSIRSKKKHIRAMTYSDDKDLAWISTAHI